MSGDWEAYEPRAWDWEFGKHMNLGGLEIWSLRAHNKAPVSEIALAFPL